MTILMPKLHRKQRSTHEWEIAVLLPVFGRTGRGYDPVTDAFKFGGWVKVLRVGLRREYCGVAIVVKWGEYHAMDWAFA